MPGPTRARVLPALREAPAYPADLASLIGVSRQVMSNHLACLRGCGLVVICAAQAAAVLAAVAAWPGAWPADPVIALGIAAWSAWEGRQAWRGASCC